jgi:hypothetical protein
MSDHNNNNNNKNGNGPLIGLVAVVILLVLGWFLVRELSASARLQDCLLSGRTNCAPIQAPSQ